MREIGHDSCVLRMELEDRPRKPNISGSAIKGDYEEIAPQFRQFRPTYPERLYDFINHHVPKKDIAWDCGTGNGQVAYSLSAHFRSVIATDSCDAQILNAKIADNISYQTHFAEASGITAQTVDLVTSAQAVHWFRINDFYDEVRRVAAKNSFIAVWGYNNFRIEPAIDRILNDFYTKHLAYYWQDPPRSLLASEYTALPFPFAEIATPRFEIRTNWFLSQLCGYLRTMSSVREYMKDHEHDPISELLDRLSKVWRRDALKDVRFPLFMRLGRIK